MTTHRGGECGKSIEVGEGVERPLDVYRPGYVGTRDGHGDLI
jgi:hypothetical protein